jgi:acetyl esterase/lipase
MPDVSYGPHPKQVMHFWKTPQAAADKPAPLLFFIHGGGWQGGDRMSGLTGMLPKLLAAGVSVVSTEYRFIKEAMDAGIEPPVQAPLSDAARALQTVRSKAAEWQIDKARIAASGGSAGACSSLWLAFHDDMADPKSDDPVARESTRLLAAAVTGAQTTLDPVQMKEWTPNSRYGGHAFGFMRNPEKRDTQFAEFLAARDRLLPVINRYSPYALVTADDPPIYLQYGAPPALGQEQKDPTHSANFGVKLKERLDAGWRALRTGLSRGGRRAARDGDGVSPRQTPRWGMSWRIHSGSGGDAWHGKTSVAPTPRRWHRAGVGAAGRRVSGRGPASTQHRLFSLRRSGIG